MCKFCKVYEKEKKLIQEASPKAKIFAAININNEEYSGAFKLNYCPECGKKMEVTKC